jgi:hypothetical protein
MAKRGRPKKHGAKQGWTLLRDSIALGGYDEARQRGEKYIVAISEAVSAVRKWDPKMHISETEVRRVLARWRSNITAAWSILPEPVKILERSAAELDSRATQDFLRIQAILMGKPLEPGGRPPKVRVISVKLGPKPSYPRINSRKPKQESAPDFTAPSIERAGIRPPQTD